jgi:hypothetical protein
VTANAPRVLSQGQGPLTAQRGRGRALAYPLRFAVDPFDCLLTRPDKRLAHNPLPRATRGALASAADRVIST